MSFVQSDTARSSPLLFFTRSAHLSLHAPMTSIATPQAASSSSGASSPTLPASASMNSKAAAAASRSNRHRSLEEPPGRSLAAASSPSPSPPAVRAAPSSAASSSSSSHGAAVSSPPPFEPFLRCTVQSYRSRVRLSKTYTEYHLTVKSKELHWDQHKRYSEFEALHKSLIELINLDPRLKVLSKSGKLVLPKLPPSKLVGNLKDDFLQTRMNALNEYIVDLLLVEPLHTCQPLLEFLGALEPTRGEASASPKSDAPEGSSPQTMPRLHLDAIIPLLDAGDVVLFRTTGVLQGLQRTFTGSRYDHVGIIIRIPWGSTKPSALHLLESTSDGVRTYQLHRRMRAWHLSNAVVVVRQLKHVTRTNSFLSTLDAFVSDVDGLPYGLSLGKLLRREPGASKDNFFCSELVATAYMRVGLIDSETHSATAFFPSDFNQERSATLLHLRDGAELGPELLVDFVQPAVREAKANYSDDEDQMEMLAVLANQSLAQRIQAAAEAKQRRDNGAARRLARDASRYDRTMSFATTTAPGTLPIRVSAATSPSHAGSGAGGAGANNGGGDISSSPLQSPPLSRAPSATSSNSAGGLLMPPGLSSFMQASSPAMRRHSGNFRSDSPVFSPTLAPFSGAIAPSNLSLGAAASVDEDDDADGCTSRLDNMLVTVSPAPSSDSSSVSPPAASPQSSPEPSAGASARAVTSLSVTSVDQECVPPTRSRSVAYSAHCVDAAAIVARSSGSVSELVVVEETVGSGSGTALQEPTPLNNFCSAAAGAASSASSPSTAARLQQTATVGE